MITEKAPLTINYYYSVPKVYVGQYKKSHSVSMQPAITMKAKIRDDLKAGGTFVKKVEVIIEKGGPRVNLVR